MKILITHAYTRKNNGDAAILFAQTKEIQRTLPSAQIVIATMEDVSINKDFYGFPQVPALISSVYSNQRGRLSNLYHFIRSLGGSYLWAVGFRYFGVSLDFFMLNSEKKFLIQLREADIIVPVGGGYILSEGKNIFDLVDLILVLQPLYLATFIKKPVILYSQSIGPFKSELHKKIVAHLLRRVTQINVREDTSFKLLGSMGIPTHIIQRTTDAAFLLADHKMDIAYPKILALTSLARKPIIGVTARAWLKGTTQSAYENEFASALDTIIERYNASVILIPQVTVKERNDDDRITQSKIFYLLKHKEYAINLGDQLDFITIKNLYGSLDYLIGTRFHSVIFSLSEHIPSIAIEYVYKTSGIMHDLGLDEWVIKMEKVTAHDIVNLFDRLVTHRNEYLKQLDHVLPAYIQQARKANDLILKIGEKY